MNIKKFDNKSLDSIKIKENKFFSLVTYGCQMNEEDSEKLSGMLKRIGYLPTEDNNKASIIIFNTCCVRENAENKVFGNVGKIKKLKEKNPNLIVAICGCMMQQKGMADKLLSMFPFVDIVFGTHNAYKFPEYLNRVLQEGVQVKEIVNKDEGIIEGVPVDRTNATKAYVTIMYGCNNFCTYCIVPYVRGRERSRKPEDIEKEIVDLVKEGYKEVTLLGQNVNSYGKGLENELSFADLLRRLNEIEGIERIRFMTSHPKDLNMDVIKAIKECDKLCEQIHLPVQSGSPRILKEMNRHYDKEYYLNLIKEIKKEIPGVGITTDLIIGFPGETEEDFNDTLDLIKQVEYDSAFTFIYSRRQYTPADKMENQIAEDVKHRRFNELVATINNIVKEKNKKLEGETLEILVEGFSKNDETKLTGRSRSGKLVNFNGDKALIGELINVKIIKSKGFSLEGEVIS
ncbi:MAG: tRNA (N6-isopentenyl adenosine(37)-C2)-methylthiotransferase MiaB [Sarcina sp.]